jgi:AcrR family transcriptional regulator
MTSGRGARAGRNDGATAPGAARLVSDIESMQVRGARKANARGDETRQKIISEAARCILEEGFAGASANHVAQRSGVTWGVIQYHFGDRAGLLRAVVQAGFDEFYARMERIDVEETGGSARERLAVVIDAGWEAFTTPICQAGIEVLVNTRTERGDDPAPATELLEMARGLHRVLVRSFPTLDGDTANVLPGVVWAALRGFVLARMMTPNDHDFRRERDLLVDVVATYIESPGPPRTRSTTTKRKVRST